MSQDSVSDAQELPAPADIARYEREAPRAGDGRTHAVSKSDGDEILALPEPPEPRLGGRLVPAPAPTNSSRAESGSTEASGN